MAPYSTTEYAPDLALQVVVTPAAAVPQPPPAPAAELGSWARPIPISLPYYFGNNVNTVSQGAWMHGWVGGCSGGAGR